VGEGPHYTGYPILLDFRYDGAGKRPGGTIRDPRNDRGYASRLKLVDENRLKVRGCLWIFCGSQTWTRIE
jgi:uncharacterized protein (DUF2147 family)